MVGWNPSSKWKDGMEVMLKEKMTIRLASCFETDSDSAPSRSPNLKNVGMDLSGPIIACISDLAFKYTELAKDLELFAQHAGRKTVTMDDVILSAHRNEYVAASLRSFSNGLKAKEPQSERKKKRMSKKVDTTASSAHIHDL
ncbi:protein MHF1 homolog isoform X2 [Ricinus communis]|uniref:protein MHF1 homolog isoform X2 n=1 Tax=Ricinus communis TaxID=3988 RepID=UPI00201A6633|nr:protein MHF1 homolog isoform X2 [Ricinus communis]